MANSNGAFEFPTLPFYHAAGQPPTPTTVFAQDGNGHVLICLPVPGCRAGKYLLAPWCPQHKIVWDSDIQVCPLCANGSKAVNKTCMVEKST